MKPGKRPLLDTLMKSISIGGIYFYWVIMLYLFFTRDFETKIYLFKTGVVGLVAVFIAKMLGKVFYLPRPFVREKFTPLYPHRPDSSFPSDHVTGAFTLSLGILKISWELGVVCLAYAVLLSFSRVYAGHHYWRDIAGGALLGWGVLILFEKILLFY